MEKSTKRILLGENIDQQMLIASTTKILTAITVIENYNLNEAVLIEKEFTNVEGSKVYLKENDIIARIDLLYALMLRSANDAALALSNNNDKYFIYQMNEIAKKIGMKFSNFENSTGLDEYEYNISTAYDLALLSAYAANNNVFLDIASSHNYKCKTLYNDYIWSNKHKLVKNDDEFIWGKTGYTKKAQRVLVSNYIHNNMDLIIVTINRSDDWNYHISLVKSLEEYKFITIFNKGIYDTLMDVNYYLDIKEDIVIPLRNDELNNLLIKFKLYRNYAIMNIYINNKLICEYKINILKNNNN